MNNSAGDRLLDAVDRLQNPSVIGLDPRVDLIPKELKDLAKAKLGGGIEGAAYAISLFNRAIIDSIYDIVPAVKPQVAFYEQYGHFGYQALQDTIQYAQSRGLIVINDSKRNDIGSTCEAYATGLLGKVSTLDGEAVTAPLQCDWLTVSPYLGSDGIKPFLEQCFGNDRGIFVLVKTSNPSSGELQDLSINSVDDSFTLYEHVAKYVSEWGQAELGRRNFSCVGAVVGATYPKQLQELRQIMPRTIFLVPGFGAQGGTAEEVVEAFNQEGHGALINAARSVIYAFNDQLNRDQKIWQQAIRAAAIEMRDEIIAALRSAKKLPSNW